VINAALSEPIHSLFTAYSHREVEGHRKDAIFLLDHT
jgi:hypothetical protein